MQRHAIPYTLLLGSLASWALINSVWAEAPLNSNAKPVLTVTTAKPTLQQLEQSLTANGNVVAWQEAIIGNEANGLRLDSVLVNVGDKVHRGDLLASFATETLEADLAQSQATVAEAEASAAEASANAARARSVKATGALSEQQIQQYLSTEKTALARLKAQRANVHMQQLRIAQAKVLAPDSGVISARNATLGAVLPAGQELFRLIRQGRLEWRAEIPAADLSRLPVGAVAQLQAPDQHNLKGKLRMLAPTINPQTRLGLAYVDLPASEHLKAGMFLHGTFNLGSSKALTVPQQAVVVRDGFNYMFRVNADQHVTQLKVQIGRRSGDAIEILSGLSADTLFVVTGAGFLNDADLVRVAPAATALPTTPKQP